MPNYTDAKIYTIRSRSDENLIYVGSTTQKLTQRLAKHRSDCKMGRCYSLYDYIINDDWCDWYIELYEAYPCNSKEELFKKEGEIIRQIATINKRIAGRTKREYYEDNVENLKEKHKEYREGNAEKLKEYKKEHYENNKDKIKENSKKYRENNAEKLKEKRKNYRENNAEKLKEIDKKYYEKIKEIMKEKVCCDICGAFIRKDGLTAHQKKKKCTDEKNEN